MQNSCEQTVNNIKIKSLAQLGEEELHKTLFKFTIDIGISSKALESPSIFKKTFRVEIIFFFLNRTKFLFLV